MHFIATSATSPVAELVPQSLGYSHPNQTLVLLKLGHLACVPVAQLDDLSWKRKWGCERAQKGAQ